MMHDSCVRTAETAGMAPGREDSGQNGRHEEDAGGDDKMEEWSMAWNRREALFVAHDHKEQW